MTQTQPARPNLGEAIALARVSLRGLLAQALDSDGIAHNDWFALNLLAMRGGVLPLEAMRAQLAAALEADTGRAGDLVDRLAAAGLLAVESTAPEGGRVVRPTQDGEALLQRARERLAHITQDLLAPFDSEEITTTERTLRAVTARAEALRAG